MKRLSEAILLAKIAYHRKRYNNVTDEESRQKHFLTYHQAEEELARRQNEVNTVNEAE